MSVNIKEGMILKKLNDVIVDTKEPIMISKSISQNGTYLAKDDSADGYSLVSVNVPKLPEYAEYEELSSPIYPTIIYNGWGSVGGLPIISTPATAANREDFSLNIPFTMEVCVYRTSSHSTNSRFFQIGVSTSYPIGCCIACNGTRNGRIEICLGGIWITDDDLPLIEEENLCTISVVVDETNIDIYKNGDFYISKEYNSSYSIIGDHMDQLYVRCGNTASREFHEGFVFSTRLYSSRLSANLIKNNYETDLSYNNDRRGEL